MYEWLYIINMMFYIKQELKHASSFTIWMIRIDAKYYSWLQL